MVGRIYGTSSCGPHGFREDFFLANDSMASIDTWSMGGRIYVGIHYISCGSRRFRENDF